MHNVKTKRGMYGGYNQNIINSTQEYELNGDPKYIGPGTWYSIHLMSLHAITMPLKNAFKTFMYNLSDKFPCEKCRTHIVQYLKENPINIRKTVKRDGKDIGMFQYGWKFHNKVNSRLGKPQVNIDNALLMYTTGENKAVKICTNECGDSPKNTIHVNTGNHINSGKNEKNVKNLKNTGYTLFQPTRNFGSSYYGYYNNNN